MVVTTAGALRLLPKIERGFHRERARLVTFRGFGTERARLGTFRGLSTERARLGTFRGFGTERARLGTLNQNFEIFTQNERLPAQRFFSESFGRKSKNCSTCCDFEKKNLDPHFIKFLNP